MRISIFGLGYVGTVSAACLAENGHEVVGVDPSQAKVDLINAGYSPILEKDITELVRGNVDGGRLRATADAADAIASTEISLICVGTPSELGGRLDLQYVQRASEQIGAALAEKQTFHTVVARSTMLPGSTRNFVIPLLEQASGKRAGADFGVCNNPEFLREGTAVYDFYNPPKTVIGEVDAKSGDILASIYDGFPGPMIRLDVESAEMVKYTDNIWHAVKISFGNEIGNLCKAIGIDGQEIMRIFCLDTKLNLSPYYLKPGFAFGGSCLPKDIRALTYHAKTLNLEQPLLDAILRSNSMQIEIGIRMITEKGNRKIGILGFSFKAGTDDLRESPMVKVIEYLVGRDYDLKIYDKNVTVGSLIGSNYEYILNVIPQISKLLVESIDDVVDHAQTIVIGHDDPDFHGLLSKVRDNQSVVDFVRIADSRSIEGRYDGICW